MELLTNPISVETEIAGRKLVIETGRIARQAAGAVTVRYGDTVAFVAVTTGPSRPGTNFFPLTVDFREMTSAAGKIPGGFFKREGRPTTKEILTCRLIDRPIRPLFPSGFQDDVMIQARVFSADGDNDADILSMIAASAALSISKLPFEGPIGAVRIGRVDGELIVNPIHMERDAGDLDLVVSGTRDAICMVEAGAEEMPEAEMLDALIKGHEECLKVIELIDELVEKVQPEKMIFVAPEADEEADEIVKGAHDKIRELNFTEGKHVRKEALGAAREEFFESFVAERKLESEDEISEWAHRISAAWGKAEKKIIRSSILQDGKRPDGRDNLTIRPIHAEVQTYPRTHGSCLFTRGETQSFVSATLGTVADEQRIDGLRSEYKKRFLLHYNFPSYCVGETWPNRGPKRREIGHGALAERAIQAVLPPFDRFPYVMRVVSEITESNGSSSMATVCGGTLSLMDAGVPIRRPVAGIAMGLIKDGDDVAILSDILGTEDHVGDMDFKVAGTQKGITALQMDMKIKGLSRELMEQALEQARVGRLHILKTMLQALSAPRPTVSEYAPKIVNIPIHSEKVGLLIGPGGRTIRSIQEETKTKIEITENDSTVCIIGDLDSEMERAIKIVSDLIRDVEVGMVYNGTVKAVKDFGAFVELVPGKEGLLPNEEMVDPPASSGRGGDRRGGRGGDRRGGRGGRGDRRHSGRRSRGKTEGGLNPGDTVVVKVIDVDPLGRIRLSAKAMLETLDIEADAEVEAEV